MLDWFTVTCGGAAIYAAGKWMHAVMRRRNINKQKQKNQGKFGQPLRLVVAQCEARWFLQELKLAMEGDAEAMVRVAHMLLAGYGTQQDHTAAAQWMRQAWAIQNYKEPAQLHDMLDVRDSAIPALNEAKARPKAAAAAAAHTVSRSCSQQALQGSSSSSKTGCSSSMPGQAPGAGGNSNLQASSTGQQLQCSGHMQHSEQCDVTMPEQQQLQWQQNDQTDQHRTQHQQLGHGVAAEPWQQRRNLKQQQARRQRVISAFSRHLPPQQDQQQQQQQQLKSAGVLASAVA